MPTAPSQPSRPLPSACWDVAVWATGTERFQGAVRAAWGPAIEAWGQPSGAHPANATWEKPGEPLPGQHGALPMAAFRATVARPGEERDWGKQAVVAFQQSLRDELKQDASNALWAIAVYDQALAQPGQAAQLDPEPYPYALLRWADARSRTVDILGFGCEQGRILKALAAACRAAPDLPVDGLMGHLAEQLLVQGNSERWGGPEGEWLGRRLAELHARRLDGLLHPAPAAARVRL